MSKENTCPAETTLLPVAVKVVEAVVKLILDSPVIAVPLISNVIVAVFASVYALTSTTL